MPFKNKPMGVNWVWSGSATVGGNLSVPGSRSWTDNVTTGSLPNWRRLLQQGQNATTTLVGTRQSLVFGECKGSIAWYDTDAKQNKVAVFDGCPTSGQLSPTWPSTNAPSNSSVDSLALGKFYNSARSKQSAMQGLTFLGELKETKETIHNVSHNIYRLFFNTMSSYKSYSKRIKKLGRKQIMKDLSNIYLEETYGIEPLFRDVQDAVSAIQKLLRRNESVACSGYSEEERQVNNSPISGNPITSDFQLYGNAVESVKMRVRYYGAIRGSITDDATQNVKNAFGLRLDEFIPTVYELIPYSFLVDYFSNLGAIVNSATYVNSNLAWSSRVTLFEWQNSASARYSHEGSTNRAYAVEGDGSIRWVTRIVNVNRAPVSPGIPGVVFKLPINVRQYVNMAALIIQGKDLSSRFQNGG